MVKACFVRNRRLYDGRGPVGAVLAAGEPGVPRVPRSAACRRRPPPPDAARPGQHLASYLDGCLRTRSHYNEATAWGHGADHKRIAALTDFDWYPGASNPETHSLQDLGDVRILCLSHDSGDIHRGDRAISSVARLEPHSVDPHPAPVRRRHRDVISPTPASATCRPFCSSPSASGKCPYLLRQGARGRELGRTDAIRRPQARVAGSPTGTACASGAWPG